MIPKRPFKARGPYEKPRNPKGQNMPKVVKMKLSPHRLRRRFYG